MPHTLRCHEKEISLKDLPPIESVYLPSGAVPFRSRMRLFRSLAARCTDSCAAIHRDTLPGSILVRKASLMRKESFNQFYFAFAQEDRSTMVTSVLAKVLVVV